MRPTKCRRGNPGVFIGNRLLSNQLRSLLYIGAFNFTFLTPPPKADRAQTASLTQTIAIRISMRHLQRTFSPVARSFSSGPLRLSNPALAQQPSDIMVRKEKRSESSPDVDKNVTESESLPPLSMKDFQVFNRMAVQMDQFVSRPLTPLKPKNKQVLIRFLPSITISV